MPSVFVYADLKIQLNLVGENFTQFGHGFYPDTLNYCGSLAYEHSLLAFFFDIEEGSNPEFFAVFTHFGIFYPCIEGVRNFFPCVKNGLFPYNLRNPKDYILIGVDVFGVEGFPFGEELYEEGKNFVYALIL